MYLLNTLNDVIGPIEKLLQALEKKSFTSKIKFTFFRSDFELEISEKCEF